MYNSNVSSLFIVKDNAVLVECTCWGFRGLHFGLKVLLSGRYGCPPASAGLRLRSRISSGGLKDGSLIRCSLGLHHSRVSLHNNPVTLPSIISTESCVNWGEVIQLVWCCERCAYFYQICSWNGFQEAKKHLLLPIPSGEKCFLTTIYLSSSSKLKGGWKWNLEKIKLICLYNI